MLDLAALARKWCPLGEAHTDSPLQDGMNGCQCGRIAHAVREALAGALERIKKSLESASEERLQELKKWERESERWRAEGDMYGWNFHQGMTAGANWCDILYRRVDREIAALRGGTP